MCSISVFWILLLIFIPLEFTISISLIIFALVFTLTHYYTRENPGTEFNSVTVLDIAGVKAGPIIVASINAVALLILALFWSQNENVYTEWNQLGILDVAKAFAAIAVCFFLPGYSLLSVVYRKKRIRPLLKILLSYLISVLFTGCTGFVVGFGHIPFFYSSLIMISISGLFLFLYVYCLIVSVRQKRFSFGSPWQGFKSRSHTLVTFICILALIVIWTYFLYDFKIIGDQWFHHGRSLLFMTDSIGNLSKLGLDAQYPPFFSAMLATYFELSGIPTANAYAIIGFLNIVPVIGFFFFFREWAPRLQKNAALLATALFVLSAGLGWVYIIYEFAFYNPPTQLNALYVLHYGGIKTFDIRIPTSFIGVGHPDITTPLILVGMPSGFVLLGLVKTEMTFRLRSIFVLGTVIITGSLFHDEFYLFVLISCILPIVMGLKSKHVYYLLPLCVFALEILIDAAAHTTYYTTREVGNLPLLALLVGSIGIMWFIYAIKIASKLTTMVRRLLPLIRASIKTKRYVGVLVIAIVVYLYAFTFIVWNYLPLREIQLQTSDKGQRIVPWYLYPTRLGVSGLLGLIYLGSYIFRKFEKWAWIFALFALVSFVAGPYYDENRFTKYVELGMVCLASLLLVEIIYKIKHRSRTIIVSMILGLVFLGSSMSILLYTSYSLLALKNEAFSQFSESLPRRFFPSSTEINFLNYLHKSLVNPSTDFIAAPSNELIRNQGFGAKLEGFVDSSITKFQQNPLILNSTTLEGLFSLLSYSNIKFLLFPLRDTSQSLTEPVKFLLNHLPQAYKDKQYKVLHVPRVDPPSTEPEVGLLYRDNETISSKELTHYLPLSVLALSNIKYDVYRSNDLSALQNKILILPTELVTSNILEFARTGGTLILLDYSNKSQIIEPTQSIEKKENVSFDKIENINGTSVLVPGIAPLLQIKNANSSITSYYYKDGQRVAPFSVQTIFGKGKLIDVNVSPYFHSIIENPNSYFSSLAEFLKVLGVKTNSIPSPEPITVHPQARFFGLLKSIGNVRIATESFSLVSPSDIHVDEINIVKNKETLAVSKNVLLSNLSILGRSEIVIESHMLRIPFTPDFDYVTGMIPGSFDIQIKVGNLSKLEMNTAPNSKHLTVGGVDVLLKGIEIKGYGNKEIPIVLKRPRIEANGTTDFNRLYSPYPNDYTKGWASNQPVTIKGYVNFTLTHSESYYAGVNSRSISYIHWNKMSGTTNILSEAIRFPADISVLAKQRNSEIPVTKAFFSEGNMKTIALVSVLSLVSLWLVRTKPTFEKR